MGFLAYSLPASSPEEFVSYVMSYGYRRIIGLDTARGYLLAGGLDPPAVMEGEVPRGRVCRGRPPPPAVELLLRGQELEYVHYGSTTFHEGIYWMWAAGIFRKGHIWRVAPSCKPSVPIFGRTEVPADVLYRALWGYAKSFYWRFWPRGLEPSGHILIAGASATGKTTLVKQLIRGRRFVVLDLTAKGEYADVGAAVRGSIDFSSYTPEEKAQLLTFAFAATVGVETAVTPVQLGALRMLANASLESILMELEKAPLPDMTKQALRAKLYSLCASVKGNFCSPRPEVTRSVEVKPGVVVRIPPEDPFLAALIAHGMVMRLLKEPQPEPTLLVIDEYHRIASKIAGVEDPVEELVRVGRHGNWTALLATQNPLDLKRSLVSIMPNFISFTLMGEAAGEAASILNVPQWVVESLRVGQWLARTRDGPRRWP